MPRNFPEHARCFVASAATATIVAIAVSPALTFAAPAKPAKPAKTQTTAADEKPTPHQGTRRYYLRQGDNPLVLAQVDYTWSHDGKRYELRSVAETVGVLAALKPTRTVQESHGEITAEGLRPSEFHHEKKNKSYTASFDWKTGMVSYRNEKSALPVGTQDVLSLYAQLAWRIPGEKNLSLPVSTGSKLATYQLNLVGEETLTINKRSQAVVHLFAQADEDRIDFWLTKPASAGSAGKGFPAEMPLPVRIRVTEHSGVIFEQSLDAPAP